MLVLVLLSATAATIAILSQQLAFKRASNAVPDEGVYWSVAQYQIAHQRLKQELRAIAAGEIPDEDELRRRDAVLASKASILTEPSEVKSLLDDVAGFDAATERLADLQVRIAPLLQRSPFTQADAITVLQLFKALNDDELLSRLANDVRLAELQAKEDMLRRLTTRLGWVWAGLGVCWTTLVLWVYAALRSRRRYAAAASDRQAAVLAMEQAIASKRKFLSMVNHEVRSPLQNIVASAELLSLKENQPESAAAIRRIQRAVKVLQAQLRDLLTIARSEAESLPTQVEAFDVGDLVRDVCADLEHAALAKGLEFRVAAPNAPMAVNADPVRIAQVLRNLVENAVRYTDCGFVEVSVDAVLGADAQAVALGTAVQTALPAWIRLVVLDTGPGLPHPASDRLTHPGIPFESGADGTGIGLFVIRDVLQQLGGQIDVQRRDASTPGLEGTTVTVSVPVTLAADIPGQALSEMVEAIDALSILIVDDRPDVLIALSDVTRRLGHSCAAVASAAEAHLLLVGIQFDVVLIDLEMPVKDGRALATEIRENGGPNGSSMLILISAAENRSIGQAWPFDGFLQKPIDGQALGRLIGSRTLL